MKKPDDLAQTLAQEYYAFGFHIQQQLEHMEMQIAQMKTAYKRFYKAINKQNARVAEKLQELIPDEPSLGMLQSDPAKFRLQKETREKALQEVSQLLESAQKTKQAERKKRYQAVKKYAEHEEKMLYEAFPQLKDDKIRRQFANDIMAIGKYLGFSEKEVKETIDHRLLLMMHLANLGLQTLQSESSKGGNGQSQMKVNLSAIRKKSTASRKH